MSRMVLFAGGPLSGQVLPVDDATAYVQGVVPPSVDLTTPFVPSAPLADIVTYVLRRAHLFGRVMWIGTIGDPDQDTGVADDVVNVVFTAEARQAMSAAMTYTDALELVRRAGSFQRAAEAIPTDETPTMTDPDSRRACCGSKWGYPHATTCKVRTEGHQP